MASIRIVAYAVLASCLHAQEGTIKTTVPLVQLSVSVTDKKGHFVYGLTVNDFAVLDESHRVPIHVDDSDTMSAPLAVIALVQVTDISDSALLKIKKVGSMISEAVIGTNGLAAAITFSDQVVVVQSLTADTGEFSNTFRNLKSVPTRQGHMLDAVAKAVDLLGSRPAGARSAIVIIGESKDRGSKTSLVTLLPRLQKADVTVYCIEYSAFLTPLTTKATEYSPPEGGRGWILDSITETAQAMKKDTGKILTTSTGGITMNFETKSKLENDLIRLGADIHSRYMLSFAPAPALYASFHRLEVRVENRPDLTVHTRPGYWSNVH